jgi:hypothetical protein
MGDRGIGRDELLDLLAGAGPVGVACREALLAGAQYVLYDEPIPAERLAQSYARRLAHLDRTGVPTAGFADAVDALRAHGAAEVLLGSASVADPPYHYQLFLSADADRVVACLGVSQG